jgi:1,2-diacylglycerol 3-beta-galactosyltransferase
MRRLLKLNPDKRVVLVVGGGDGVGKIVNIAHEIAKLLGKSKTDLFQLVVICGSNSKVKTKLKKLMTKNNKKFGNVDVSILDYVSNMHEYMSASECIVTKVRVLEFLYVLGGMGSQGSQTHIQIIMPVDSKGFLFDPNQS